MLISRAAHELQQAKCHVRCVWKGGGGGGATPPRCTVTEHKSVPLVLCQMLFCGAELSDLFGIQGSRTQL